MRILILRSGALGDTLMLLPAVQALRPRADILLVGRPPGLGFLRPYVHRAVSIEGPGWHRLYMEDPESAQGPPMPEADIVAALVQDPEGIVRRNLRTLIPAGAVYRFPPLPLEGDETHVALYTARCLREAGCPLDPDGCIARALTGPLLATGDRPGREGIVFHPGSGSPGKNHPPAFWLHLAGAFAEHSSLQDEPLRILLGPAEEKDRALFAEGTKGARLCLQPDRAGLLSLLGGARLYVGHDSGITHLAAMLGTPTVALFRDTPVHRWRPLGPAVAVVAGRDREIAPDRVVKEATELLDRILATGTRR
ncbi:MAG: glycosyltransferase family 9 protein [Deltaproteobacteria bacterium]|nr:glycosyltransferase family 9 protein [Deltaproteobacteria bacterium]